MRVQACGIYEQNGVRLRFRELHVSTNNEYVRAAF